VKVDRKTWLGVVYKQEGEAGKRPLLIQKEFYTMDDALQWIGPYLLDGFPYDIFQPGYVKDEPIA